MTYLVLSVLLSIDDLESKSDPMLLLAAESVLQNHCYGVS